MSNYLIVGASSGIGRQLALQLAESGHRVYGTYNQTEMKRDTPKGLEYHRYNVLDPKPGLDFLPATLEGLVYCPGSITLKPFQRISPDTFAEDFQLQVNGAVKVLQAALPSLKSSSEHPAIVFFSTAAVQTGYNYHSLVASSKGALEGLARALAAEFAPDIRVNCIAPSLTDTPLAAPLLNSEKKREANAERHPMKRLGTPRDIADMAEFLLGPEAGWITGQILHVDGGISTLNAN